ncbi:hypothetical protein [Salinispora arenicola]|uniref:hypothetical protein n=1 Tax=Salinispora arenicola TaxID=168697 RepID=UPI0003A0738E|nr:hypothetical protein [Salinispora arenicola]
MCIVVTVSGAALQVVILIVAQQDRVRHRNQGQPAGNARLAAGRLLTRAGSPPSHPRQQRPPAVP